MTFHLTKKQGLAILAMLAAGALLAALILNLKRSAPDAEAAHEKVEQHAGKAAEHGEHDEHKDEHKDEPAKLLLNAAQLKAAGLTLLAAGPGAIAQNIALPGEIGYNQDRTAHVVPRLAGVVDSVHADLGQIVQKGQVLAVIASSGLSELRSEWLSAQRRLALARSVHAREARLWAEKISAEQDYLQAGQTLAEAEIAVHNASQKLRALGAGAAPSGALNRYEIRAPFKAMVMEKHIALGEAVKEDANIFLLSDLSTVWAEISVPASQLNSVRSGARASVRAAAFDASAQGVVTYVGALIGAQSRSASARVTLDNPAMVWRPGLPVSVELAAAATAAAPLQVPVSVALEALHTVDGKAIVFVALEGGFAAQAVKTGRADGKLVEITEGLTAGQRYAAAGSFILKSELGKTSAGHEH